MRKDWGREAPSPLVGSIRRILHDANVHRLSNRYSNRLSCLVIDEARRTFKEDIARVLVDIDLAKRLQRVVAAALNLDWELIAPAPRQPYSLLGRPEIAVLVEEKGVQPLRRAVGILVGRDLVAVGEVVQVDPRAVGEAQRGPFPGLCQEVAPLAVDPPLPGHVDLALDAAFSGVSDPAYDLDTRQRIIVAPVLRRSLLNEALDAELVLGVHHLLRACEAQIVGELRRCDRQVHDVTVVGPLGAIVARDETNRVGLRIPSVGLIHYCCRKISDMEVVAVVREAGYRDDCPLVTRKACGRRSPLLATEVEGTPSQEIGVPGCIVDEPGHVPPLGSGLALFGMRLPLLDG